jgi:predicted amidohydrolase
MIVKIAVVQQDHNPGGVEENRRKAVASAKTALNNNADIILFHEELTAGYTEDPRMLAEPADGLSTQLFRETLKGSRSRILYGLSEKDGNDHYISAVLVGDEGICAIYRKTHLWWNAYGARYEPGFYRPGDNWTVFEIKGYRCGIMICYDGDFPETSRSYANLGCSMLFWMNNRCSRGYEETRAIAVNNSMIVASSCCCGFNESGDACGGGSNIVGAGGELLSEIWDKEGIIYADVDPEEALKMRKRNSLYIGQRRDIYC